MKFLILLLAGMCVSSLSAGSAIGGPVTDVLEATYLVGIKEGSSLSDIAYEASTRTYELRDGTVLDLEKWYGRKTVDMRFDFMTQTSERTGILWGFSTGERGKKYKIEPALRIGLIGLLQPMPASTLSFSITTTFAGRLRERSCTATYFDDGEAEPVNCRLAATVIEPAETLRYLWNVRPPDHTRLGFRYLLQF